MNLKDQLNLKFQSDEMKNVANALRERELNGVKGGAPIDGGSPPICACGGTTCGTHGARDGLKDAG